MKLSVTAYDESDVWVTVSVIIVVTGSEVTLITVVTMKTDEIDVSVTVAA